MGLDTDPDAPEVRSDAVTRTASIQDDRNQQSFQVRSSKTLLGDIAVFDTRRKQWVTRRALDGSSNAPGADVDEAGNSTRPSPRYAHLSTLLGSRLLVVGGQDLEEQYVEELNVFDLQLGRWVLRSPFPRAVGLYRSFIANVPATGSTLLYSNYSFASVKRALYLLSAPPDCTLKEISDQLDGEPPGLRFPRGHLVDPQTIIMSGTLISTEGHSEMSLWALSSKTLHWRPISCGAKFRTGSWNQSIVDPRTNTLVLFGDSRRDLTYDYQRRRLNYGEIRAVDLRALGYMRAAQGPELPLAIAASPLSAARTAATGTLSQASSPAGSKGAADVLGFEIGSQLLHFTLFSDAEVVAADGSCVAEINSGLLCKRWPEQAKLWQTAANAAEGRLRPDSQTEGSLLRRPESSLLSGDFKDADASDADDATAVEGPRRYLVDGTREAIYLLIFYLYTGIVDPSARFGLHQGAEVAATAAAKDELGVVRVLGELLAIARKYSLDPLALRLVSLLRWRVTEATAPLVYEAALQAEHQGLQARSVIAVRDHIAVLRASRKSTLYMIGAAARTSLLRYFPKLAAQDEPPAVSEDARPGYASSVHSHQDVRQRAPSDAIMSNGDMASGGPRNGAFPSPSSSSGSPASTLRNPQTRSPYAPELANPRRPWETATMASPVINSPVSGRFSSQSPEIRGGSSMSDSNKRMSHLAAQPLPEDAAINYAHEHPMPPLPDTSQSQPTSSHSSKRMSRYLGSIAGNSPTESMPHDRRTSDASSANDVILQPPQQQQQSSRSFFRPWSKVKKLTSSTQVSTDSLAPAPSHASTYSSSSAQ
ncbi:hypothetical protein H4R23_003886 [Coemansia sp. Cherry 401B]|nr:hypothetical protein H4R23_003886 [Coemansia sp. Cherry 401B]